MDGDNGVMRPCAKCSPCLKSLILIVTHPRGAGAAARHSHRAVGQLAQDHTALGKRQGGIQDLGNHSVASWDEGGGVSVPQMWTPSSSVLCTPTPAGCWVSLGLGHAYWPQPLSEPTTVPASLFV